MRVDLRTSGFMIVERSDKNPKDAYIYSLHNRSSQSNENGTKGMTQGGRHIQPNKKFDLIAMPFHQNSTLLLQDN